ncbi:hypothetical protein AB0F46_08935 [Streptomyces sp. NPDC026665]|uniref:hypothetical protein n=1 Tax=Streptomyces sp. NPDC026665 TaxID=3154798 RepID=UPI003404F9F4
MRGAQKSQVIGRVIGGGFIVVSVALRVHSWRERGFVTVMLLGACGFAFLFHHWRVRGDLTARPWLLGGVALWALTVAVASFDDSAAGPVAVLAATVGVTGALVTLIRGARLRKKADPTTLDG